MGPAYTGKDGLLHNVTLPYPSTMGEIESADRLQLGRWVRFLPSPGLGAIGKNQKEFKIIADEEKDKLTHIMERFEFLGGWDSPLSKYIGWTL
ncbi:MAG: hypothetical protein JRE23_03230 [Deltaproteobacteria bacterium]|nr:hypothetical protein [Deltaproteobacteria bacterium]